MPGTAPLKFDAENVITESQWPESPRGNGGSSKDKLPEGNKQKEGEAIEITRRMDTEMAEEGEDDEPPRVVADYIHTPRKPRAMRRIQATEEADEDKQS